MAGLLARAIFAGQPEIEVDNSEVFCAFDPLFMTSRSISYANLYKFCEHFQT